MGTKARFLLVVCKKYQMYFTFRKAERKISAAKILEEKARIATSFDKVSTKMYQCEG